MSVIYFESDRIEGLLNKTVHETRNTQPKKERKKIETVCIVSDSNGTGRHNKYPHTKRERGGGFAMALLGSSDLGCELTGTWLGIYEGRRFLEGYVLGCRSFEHTYISNLCLCDRYHFVEYNRIYLIGYMVGWQDIVRVVATFWNTTCAATLENLHNFG